MKYRLPPQPHEWIDRSRPLQFTFEGRPYNSFAGDTITSADRPRGLAGKAFLKEIHFKMQKQATFEVVYGHAWAPAPRSEPAAKTVRVFKHLP